MNDTPFSVAFPFLKPFVNCCTKNIQASEKEPLLKEQTESTKK